MEAAAGDVEAAIASYERVLSHLNTLIAPEYLNSALIQPYAGDVEAEIASYETVLSHLHTFIAPEYLISSLNRAFMQAMSRPQ